LRRDSRRLVQLVVFVVGALVATLQPLVDHHVARRAGAHAPTRMVQPDPSAQRDIQDAPRQPVVAIGHLRRVHFHFLGLPFVVKGDLVLLRGRLVARFLDVRIFAAHFDSPSVLSRRKGGVSTPPKPRHQQILLFPLLSSISSLTPPTASSPPPSRAAPGSSWPQPAAPWPDSMPRCARAPACNPRRAWTPEAQPPRR